MAITNKGRIICWSENVTQTKSKEDKGFSCFKGGDLCSAPVDYTTHMHTAIFSAAKISQISEVYVSDALCCCFCKDYECKVEITFEQYKPSNDSFVRVESKWSFYHTIQSILDTGLAMVESAMFVSRRPHSLWVVSGSQDALHNNEVHTVLKELSGLYHSVIQALPAAQIPDVFYNDHKRDIESGLPVVSEKYEGVTIVTDSGKVTIPAVWLSLLKGEEIITSHGEVYRMDGCDWLFTSIIWKDYRKI